jgi:ATP-binding protein involved in chromosome partitioning
MTEISKNTIEALLQNISFPGKSINLVEAKAVTAIVIDAGNVGIVLDFGDAAISSIEGSKGTIEATRQGVEKAVSSLDGVNQVNVVVTASKKPQTGPGKPAAPKATPAPPTPMEIPGVKHIIAIASGKGGVGKSTTSANLAAALSGLGYKVGVMDADIFGPSMPMLFNLSERPEIIDGVIQPLVSNDIKVMSIGSLIDIDQPVVWRGPRVMGATQQLLKDVAWAPIDILVVDMPPGTGDVQLSLVQNAPLSGAVIVSTPQDLALIDARKGLAMFQKTNIPILGLIENMSYFICPNCGEESHVFGHGGAKETAEKLGCDFLGGIPLHMEIRELSDAGTPIVIKEPESTFAKLYQGIARDLANKLGL